MFDSPLCERQFTGFPLFLNWGQFDWLKIPLLLVLILLTFLGLRWIIRRLRWKRHLSSSKGILVLTGITATLLILLDGTPPTFGIRLKSGELSKIIEDLGE